MKNALPPFVSFFPIPHPPTKFWDFQASSFRKRFELRKVLWCHFTGVVIFEFVVSWDDNSAQAGADVLLQEVQIPSERTLHKIRISNNDGFLKKVIMIVITSIFLIVETYGF